MPPWGPVSRRQFIRALKDLRFHGPYAGGRHEYMIRADVTIPIPNPHGGDIGFPLLPKVLREAGISRREWESV